MSSTTNASSRIEIAAKRAILNLHEHHRDHVVTHAPNQYITDVLATALGYGGVALLGVRLIPNKEPDPSLASA